MHLAGIEAAGNTVSRTARYLIRSAALVAFGAVGFLSLTGCGNNYRPVVSAINPVGPSGQPVKYAVAISSPSPTLPGLVTIVNFSGDTVQITANIGVSPQYLIIGPNSIGYTINGDGTLNSFGISTTLLTSQVLQTTLLAGAQPVSIFPQGTNIYVADPGRDVIGDFQSSTSSTSSAGSPLVLKQEFTVAKPIYVVGVSTSTRAYALSQGSSPSTPGSAIGIDATTTTPLPSLTVGADPVYGVMTADGKRAFIMNKGDGTVSVINVQTNQLDTFSTTPPVAGAPVPPSTSTIPVGVNPLWADFAPTLSEMVVANAGDGTNNGSLSIVSIPLCSVTAQTSNPNCDPNNPVDAAGFGSVLANVPVGVNPVMVAALQDGTQAYVANAGNPNIACATVDASGNPTTTPTGNCSISVVDLGTNRVSATIPIAGRPTYIAATTGSPAGKVYVVCGADPVVTATGKTDTNSKIMTIIRTDTNSIDTTVQLQGTGVAVRVTAP